MAPWFARAVQSWADRKLWCQENARTMDTQGLIGELSAMKGHTAMGIYWVNLSKTEGMDMGFQGDLVFR